MNTESRKVELRGIRLRVSPSPGDNEAGQVRERLERIKAAHFNAVYLEAADQAGAGADPRPSGSANSGAAANPNANPIPASPASAARPSFAAMQVYIEEGAKLGLAVYAGEAGPFGGKQGAAIVDIRIGAETDPAAVRKLIRQNGADHGIGAIITGGRGVLRRRL
ncbi:hypothetical protein L5D93_06455 [Paenibacillus thiaminolyticus]|nr:hypothetical protein [Paenibacillus thiaminolyticus]